LIKIKNQYSCDYQCSVLQRADNFLGGVRIFLGNIYSAICIPRANLQIKHSARFYDEL